MKVLVALPEFVVLDAAVLVIVDPDPVSVPVFEGSDAVFVPVDVTASVADPVCEVTLTPLVIASAVFEEDVSRLSMT